MTEKPREHTADRGCWCTPIAVAVGTIMLTEYAGKTVKRTPLDHGMELLHFEEPIEGLAKVKE